MTITYFEYLNDACAVTVCDEEFILRGNLCGRIFTLHLS